MPERSSVSTLDAATLKKAADAAERLLRLAADIVGAGAYRTKMAC